MNKKCSVCKQTLIEVSYGKGLYKCLCGHWKPGINEAYVFEDASSKAPTLRFLIDN